MKTKPSAHILHNQSTNNGVPGKKSRSKVENKLVITLIFLISHYIHIFKKPKCRTVKGKVVFFLEMSSVQWQFCERMTFLTCKRGKGHQYNSTICQNWKYFMNIFEWDISLANEVNTWFLTFAIVMIFKQNELYFRDIKKNKLKKQKKQKTKQKKRSEEDWISCANNSF